MSHSPVRANLANPHRIYRAANIGTRSNHVHGLDKLAIQEGLDAEAPIIFRFRQGPTGRM